MLFCKNQTQSFRFEYLLFLCNDFTLHNSQSHHFIMCDIHNHEDFSSNALQCGNKLEN